MCAGKKCSYMFYNLYNIYCDLDIQVERFCMDSGDVKETEIRDRTPRKF